MRDDGMDVDAETVYVFMSLPFPPSTTLKSES